MAEVHTVTTPQGYVLTLVRCNSKTPQPTSSNKNVVIIQHGILGTSDGFTINPPNQGLGKFWCAIYDFYLQLNTFVFHLTAV